MDTRLFWEHNGIKAYPRSIFAMGQVFGQTSEYKRLSDGKGRYKDHSQWWAINFRDENEESKQALCSTKEVCRQVIQTLEEIEGEWGKHMKKRHKVLPLFAMSNPSGGIGARDFFRVRQGRYTYETEEQAHSLANAFASNPHNDPKLVQGLRSDPCLCWPKHFDPIRILTRYFDSLRWLCEVV